MSNDYNLLRSVLDMKKDDDVSIAEVLSSLEADEISCKTPEAQGGDDEYTPENTEGPPQTPPPKKPGSEPPQPPGGDPVCARYFESMNKNDPSTPAPNFKRGGGDGSVFDIAKYNGGKISFSRSCSGTPPIEKVDETKKGHFLKAKVNIPAKVLVTLANVDFDDWISSYKTNPPNVQVTFFKDKLGQRWCASPDDIILEYVVGTNFSISETLNHNPGSKTQIKKIKISDMKKMSEYASNMGRIDADIERELKEFWKTDKLHPDPTVDDLEKWVVSHVKWFGWDKTDDGEPNYPCAYQKDEEKNQKLTGESMFLAMRMRQGACRTRAAVFFIMATSCGIPCHYITNDCHAFVEIWVPGIGWNIYNCGGCSPPGQDGDQPLDPDARFDKQPPFTQPPPPKDEDETPPSEGKPLLDKQIEAIVAKALSEGVGCDNVKLIEALREDASKYKRTRFF